MSRPFVKWAGGKSQSLNILKNHVPDTFNKYYEPFVGGGALFFSLAPKKALIGDLNKDLMITYQVVRDDLEALIELLSSYINTEEFFKNIRAKNPQDLSDLERASRFIFLNKTCFNGLYRVNKKGEFNVGWGKNPKALFCDKNVLTLCSKALQGAEIVQGSFDSIVGITEPDDFIYLDPPYLPIAGTSFTSYTSESFLIKEHENLANFVDKISSYGTKVLLSSSDTGWVRWRYRDYEFIEIESRRSINSDAKGRGKISELLIKNF